MKSFLLRIALFICWFIPLQSHAAGFQTDPLLMGAIYSQTDALKDVYKKRSKMHESIITAQAGITLALDQIHRVEEKMLDYLSNASGVLQNLYQIKRIGELTLVEIPNNLTKLGKAIPDNLKGTAITLFVNKTVTETVTDITALSEIVTRLVTSHYSFKDNKKDDKNINLLSAAERFQILMSVKDKLDRINWRLYITQYYIKTLGWKDLWYGIDRESYCNIMYGKMKVNNLVSRWNQLTGKSYY